MAGSGVWCLDASVSTLLRLGASFDWVCLDMQHGRFGRSDLLAVCRSWAPEQAALVVRAPSIDVAAIGWALDAGARSVIVPQVDSVDDARRVVSAMYYPPRGRRSYGPLMPAWGRVAPSVSDANATAECVVMIESAAALGKAAEIAAVDGVTGLFVGPYDLSLSLGITVEALLAGRSESAPLPAVVAAARRHGRAVGVFTGDPAAARRLHGLDVDAVAGVTDGWLLAAGIRSALTSSDESA
ncbi:MAG: aldolase [Nocardioidaceae bacterium]|jgi:2-keto-3-deoxy-L-rhamnonate aldolase RhmA|nr:aldolase [Nocardioidaceae bacterium]